MKILLVALLEYMHIRLYFLILCIQHLTLNYQVIFFHSPQKIFFVQFFVRISNQQDTPARAPSR